jgi:hypothetical protein
VEESFKKQISEAGSKLCFVSRLRFAALEMRVHLPFVGKTSWHGHLGRVLHGLEARATLRKKIYLQITDAPSK